MTPSPKTRNRVVFLLDVDNTLLDNDRVTAELRSYLTREFGEDCRERYWAIFDSLRAELGYADYLGASSATASTTCTIPTSSVSLPSS